MTQRKSNRRDEKLEANGIKRKDWVAQAIALAGMHGTGARRAQGKRSKREEPVDDADEAEADEADDD
jgi:predicted Abi (CAAX) family protease